MKQKNILSLTKKELNGYLNNPTAYIAVVVFLLLWEFLFFRSAFLINEASIRLLLSFVPWLFILLIPALTMGSISSEKKEGTLELILTHPVTPLELLTAKFISTLIFVSISLAFMFPIAYSLDRFGNLDWGVVAGQYFASIMVSSIFISLGLFVSSLFASQISSLLVAAVASFFLVIAGFEIITLSLPAQVAQVFENLSALTHFNSMSRGVIDLRDIWYFVSASTIFLSLAYLQIARIRIGNQRSVFQRYIVGTSLFIAIAILANIVGARIPGRLDLTQDKSYQLTQTTKNTLKDLDDIVNIKLYATSELPVQLRPTLRDIKDTLKDYQTAGYGNVTVSIQDPNTDTQTASEATSFGIREVQFNVVGQEELQVKKGYLGLAVLYGSETEAIPLISDTSDLEYQLTSLIKKLTTTEKKKIAFLTGHLEKSPLSDYFTFSQELQKIYLVDELNLDEQEAVPAEYTTLVVAGPKNPVEEPTRAKIDSFLNQGGSALFLIDAVNINENLLEPSTNTNSMADFVESFGVEIGTDLVYDLRSSETVNFGINSGVSYVLNYPFWPRVLAADKTSPIVNNIDTIVLPWPSSIVLNQETTASKNFEVKKLFSTTPFGSLQSGTFNISPNQQLLTSNLGEHTTAVSLLGQENDQGKVSRMVVVTDSDFLSEQFTTNNQENLAFGIDAISWLSQEESLAQIQLKQRTFRNLIFKDQTQPALIKYANLIFAFALPSILGFTKMTRRRSLKQFKYSSSN